jgi:hypothetical protein
MKPTSQNFALGGSSMQQQQHVYHKKTIIRSMFAVCCRAYIQRSCHRHMNGSEPDQHVVHVNFLLWQNDLDLSDCCSSICKIL